MSLDDLLDVECYYSGYTSPAITWGPCDKRGFYEVHYVNKSGKWRRLCKAFGWMSQENDRKIASVMLEHYFKRPATEAEITKLIQTPAKSLCRIEASLLNQIFNPKEKTAMKAKSKSEQKRRDVQMAGANDKDGAAAAAKLPSVVNTNEEYTIQARYHFTEQEKKRMAGQLAELQIQLAEHEEQKKAAMASFKDRIETVRLQLSQISRGYRDGYELRDHRVTVTYDYKKKEKRYLEVGTKKVVDRKPFVPGDEQRKFPGI